MHSVCLLEDGLSQKPQYYIIQTKLKQLFFIIFLKFFYSIFQPFRDFFFFFLNIFILYYVGLVTCIMTVGIGVRNKQQTAKSAP